METLFTFIYNIYIYLITGIGNCLQLIVLVHRGNIKVMKFTLVKFKYVYILTDIILNKQY